MLEKTFTDTTWEKEVLNSTAPVVVDFWAEWCSPCQMIASAVEKIAEEYRERIKIGKLNIDENPLTAREYSVMGIPSLYSVSMEK